MIGAPIRMFYAAEAYQQYWFGWVRFIHFLAAFIYVFNFLARLYWGFVGNKYASWAPSSRSSPRSARRSSTSSRPTCFETKLHGPISTGHNALAGLIYFGTFLAFVAQTITGFALYSSMSNSWLPRMFVLDRAADGRRVQRALLASPVPVVLRHLHHRSHLSCLLSRLHRRPRHGLFDHRRMEVRAGEE
jgi:thiosulfate reductase cytochrome b subunit